MAAWEAWAPPLDPPSSGGLPVEEAERIADAWWDELPHLCAALQWEAYAATLPPRCRSRRSPPGCSRVSYGRAVPAGALGEAMTRAAWHRSLLSELGSVPLRVAGRR